MSFTFSSNVLFGTSLEDAPSVVTADDFQSADQSTSSHRINEEHALVVELDEQPTENPQGYVPGCKTEKNSVFEKFTKNLERGVRGHMSSPIPTKG